MSPSRSDLPQGTLDMLILRVLSLEPLHGYAVAQRLRQMSRDVVQVPQGSLYPALHRLEQRRLLRAVWRRSETGRDAKYYELTAAGRTYLQSEADNWQRLAEAVRLIFHGGEGELQ